MIRLYYDPQLPMLAAIGQEDDRVALVVNQYAQMLLTYTERMNLFNDLMRALEEHSGGHLNLTVDGRNGPAVVIHLSDLRQRKEIALALARGFAINE